MGHQQTFAISAAGMDIERLRVDVAAANLAHANAVVDPSGEGFQPMRVVAHARTPGAAFSTHFNRLTQPPAATLEASAAAPRRVMEPGHPLADAQGMVSYPAVDTTTEMVTMMGAMRAYEANVAAMNTSRAMAMKALEIGGGQ